MANDFYSKDDNESYQKTVAMCVAAASLVVLIFLAVLYNGTAKKKAAVKSANANKQVEQEENSEFVTNSHNFRSEELDFWESAQAEEVTREDESEGELTPYKKKDKNNITDSDKTTISDLMESNKKTDDSKDVSADKDSGEGSLNKDPEEETAEDENHLAVTDDKGIKKYYEILSSVKKNEYDLENGLRKEEGELKYSDSKRQSVKGIDLSKYNGDVDFKALKDSGVDFVMLRLGSRGYGTGLIELDEKFVEYAQNAAINNIAVGAYFYSQAITETEAIEEANYIVGAIGAFNVKYPVAIDVEKVGVNDARADKLTAAERTNLVKLFCNTVKSYGYQPLIYANRDLLISGLNMEELAGFDVWLSDFNVPTDYPYDFTIWQYTKSARVNGINGNADLNISFVEYDRR